MGAMIVIHYDNTVVAKDRMGELSNHLQRIVKDVMATKDVFVYANTAQITIADPIEVFIQVNTNEVPDPSVVVNAIVERLSSWKHDTGFITPVNLNVIPVQWHYKIGV